MAPEAIINQYLNQIISTLKDMNVSKIILFGSYAIGNIHEDSDIDLLVVVNENFIPKDFNEWLEIKFSIRKALRNINDQIPIDLLVYTLPQYEIIKKNMNSFQREIHETGKLIYEKAS